MDSVFSLRHVDVVRDGTDVLSDVSIEVPGNGITALAGPSGAGKSSLLRLLNRLDVPTRGTISFRGDPLETLDAPALRRRVAMVFQRPPVFPGTVGDNLRTARLDVTDARAEEVLGAVSLDPETLDRDAETLSGGEAQRLCVARALLTDPEVLLADEPTASLDTAARDQIEELARRLAGDGMPIVWISHDVGQLRRLADHVVVLVDGRVRAQGTPAALTDHPDDDVRGAMGADS